jgi:colicin import membrane protein/protein TonB
VVAVPAEKAPRPAAPRAAAAPGPTERAGKAAGARLASVLSELKQELQAGRPDGAPDGDASEAGEGDQYLALVVRQLRQGYRLPATIGERERLFLTGTVVLYIEPDGRISRYELVKRSGNPAFDDALERDVRETRLPPPPPAMRDLYRRTGLEVLFKI